jgi:hypothetical protein
MKCQGCEIGHYKYIKMDIHQEIDGGPTILVKNQLIKKCSDCGNEVVSVKELTLRNQFVLSELIKCYSQYPLTGKAAKWIRTAIDLPVKDLVAESRVNEKKHLKAESENLIIDHVTAVVLLLKVKRFLTEGKLN